MALPAAALAFADPLTGALHLAVGALVHFADSGHDSIARLLTAYLFQTVDAASPAHGALTGNPALAQLNFGVSLMADALLGAVLVVAFLRFMFDHSMRSHYRFREVMPRLLLALALVHFSLPLMQLLIDLNNGLGAAALQLGSGPTQTAPWDQALGHGSLAPVALGQDLFLAVFACALVVVLVLLAMALVVRYALLGVLVVTAPLAALCLVLTETRGYAHTWTHLFTTTLFMQAVQLMVLRVAMSIAFGNQSMLPQTLYSLATLWLMLKVPGALSSGSHWETKAKTWGHDLGKSARKFVDPPHHAAAHSTAHSATHAASRVAS